MKSEWRLQKINFAFFVVVSPSIAEIKSLVISNDARAMIFFKKFRFTHTGHATVFISIVPTSSDLDLEASRLNFFVLSEESVHFQRSISSAELPIQPVLPHYFLIYSLSPSPNFGTNIYNKDPNDLKTIYLLDPSSYRFSTPSSATSFIGPISSWQGEEGRFGFNLF